MASPGDLVRCVSRVLQMPEPTVVQYDRILAANGLRSKGGRGRSAAKVTATDAANLIIAIAGAPLSGPTVKETLATWESFHALKATAARDGGQDRPADFSPFKNQIPTLARLKPGHNFRDGIAALIEAVALGEFEELRASAGEAQEAKVFINFQVPVVRAHLAVMLTDGPYAHISYGFRSGARRLQAYGDLRQERTISNRTILALADMLKQRSPTDRVATRRGGR